VIFKKYRSLTVNGKKFSTPELKLLCDKKSNSLNKENWEHKLYSFISEWLNESPTVEARTSGTTGAPKEISIRKDKMLQSARLTIRHLHLQSKDSAIHCLTCEHIAGKMMVVRAFAGELNLITVEPTSNPLQSIPIDKRIDFAAFVPLQVKEILSDKKTANQFTQIKNVLIGGAAIPFELNTNLKVLRNNIYETYGMTETISHIALKKLSTGNRQLITDNSDYFTTLEGITVKTDDRNCLVISAPHISDNPIITNDIIELKDEKNFKWLGRFYNVVNSGGVKLIPELLEEKIREVVQRRYFFKGLPDERLGEKLVLIIEGKEFSENELYQLKIRLSKNLAKYEIPKEIIFIPKFKIMDTGKIKIAIS